MQSTTMEQEYIAKITTFYTELSPYVVKMKKHFKLYLTSHVDDVWWAIHVVDNDDMSVKCLEIERHVLSRRGFDRFINDAIEKIKPYCK